MKCVLGSMIFRFFLLASKTDKPLGVKLLMLYKNTLIKELKFPRQEIS